MDSAVPSLPVLPRRPLRLAGVTGVADGVRADLSVDEPLEGIPGGGGDIVIRTRPVPGDAPEALERLAGTGHLLVAVDALNAPAVLEGLALRADGVAPVMAADPDNPIVAAARLEPEGCGAWDGWRLSCRSACALPPGGEPLARVGEAVVAARYPVGGGSLVLIGTTDVLEDPWLGRQDNARALRWALSGEADPYPMDGLGRAPSDPTALAVEATDASGQDWSGIVALDGPWDIGDEAFVDACAAAGRLLPGPVYDALTRFADHPPASAAIVVKGVPVGDVGPTPNTPGSVPHKDRVSEHALVTAARLLGQPVGYRPEQGGRLVQDIWPKEADAEVQISGSSKVELLLHTEAAFHPHRPRYLLLLCLRSDHDRVAQTTLTPVAALLSQLDLPTRSVLFEPRFATGVDTSYLLSYDQHRGHSRSRPRAVLEGDWDAPLLTFDHDLMTGLDPAATRALEIVAEASAACRTGVVLEAGDLLVVDNHRAVHGRTVFSPRFDGQDRWLQRSMAVADLDESANDRMGRVVTTRFLP